MRENMKNEEIRNNILKNINVFLPHMSFKEDVLLLNRRGLIGLFFMIRLMLESFMFLLIFVAIITLFNFYLYVFNLKHRNDFLFFLLTTNNLNELFSSNTTVIYSIKKPKKQLLPNYYLNIYENGVITKQKVICVIPDYIRDENIPGKILTIGKKTYFIPQYVIDGKE